MKTKFRIIMLSVFLFLLLSNTIAQEKYAVIITGDEPYSTGSWGDLNGEGRATWEEFWNDTYLMWELLLEKGYSNENIYVLYANGEDYTFPDMYFRYTISYTDEDNITDFPADKGNVEMVLTSMADGSNPAIPQLTVDDFLYIYTFGHGYNTTEIPGHLGNTHTFLALMGYDNTLGYDEETSLTDIELNTFLDNINAVKKVVVMQQCYSGGFIQELADTDVIICTAANDYMGSKLADKKYFTDISYWNDDEPGDLYIVENEFEFYTEDPTAHVFTHAEFNLHLFNSLKGFTPDDMTPYYSVPGLQDFPLSDADLNTDNIISMQEAYDWVINFDSWMRYYPLDHDDPQLSSPNDIANYTSLEYPTLMFENIGPVGGLSIEHRGIIGITKDVHIESTNQLTFLNNADVYLLNDAKLIVDAGATLILEDNVSIIATNENNGLHVFGELQVGNNITFSAEGDNLLTLMIENPSLSVSFDFATFQNTIINCEARSLSMFSSDLTFSNVQQTTGDLSIFVSTLNNSSIEAVNTTPNTENTFISAFNTFTSGFPNTNAIIKVDGYSNYHIADNSIQNDILTSGLFYGILVSNSSNRTHFHIIENNTILSTTACGFGNPCAIGLTIYSSYAEIKNNIIKFNDVGIEILNNSIAEISGNENATVEEETQIIKNNNMYQVFISSSAFPTSFYWNAIYEDSYSSYFIYREIESGGVYPKADIRYNYWGINFNANNNLFPLDHYGYEPIWDLGGGSSIDQTDAGLLFLDATNQVADSTYGIAKSTFQQVVTTYPETDFAKSSMRELLNLEPLSDSNYINLKNWYLTEAVIQDNDLLRKVGNDLSTKCDERLENYPDAITWYESVIDSPETLEDSVFAIIDLEHVYLQMGTDTNSRSAYVGSMPQYRPTSIKDHQQHKDKLLALLLINHQYKNDYSNPDFDNTELPKLGLLYQNSPNPVINSTNINYELKKESNIKFHIYNHTGQLVKTINVGTKYKGSHSFEFDAQGLESGLYFYSIYINGQNIDSRKMTIIN